MGEILDDKLESENQPTEEVENTEVVEEVTDIVEETEDLEALREKNKKLFERAKKAEAEAKDLKAKAVKPEAEAKVEPSQKQDGITAMDAMALMGAKVTVKEDIDEVVDYAKFKGITVAEALNASAVKSILAERAEQRQTSDATNTGNARRGTTAPSSETILANASKGKLPDDAEALAEAHMASMKK